MNLFNKNKKIRLTTEQYGKILFNIIGIGEENFFNTCNFLESTIISQELYYIFHLYICKHILQKKYSDKISNNIINAAQSAIINYQAERMSDIDKLQFSTELNELYTTVFSSLEETNPSIDKNKKDLMELSKAFLDYLDLTILDVEKIMIISIEFSTFYTYHFSDILNSNINLVI